MSNKIHMKRIIKFLLKVQLIFIAALVFGDANLTGVDTVPDSPAVLKPGDSFLCKNNGHGRITYADGVYLGLLGGCQGKLTPDGIQLKKGGIWISYRKKGGSFIVQTPYSIIGIRGTEFGLTVGADESVLTLVKGRLEVVPTSGGETVNLIAGQVLKYKAGKWEVCKISEVDTRQWEKFMTENGTPETRRMKMPRFSDQFMYSLPALNGGVIDLVASDGSRITASKKGTIIRAGLTIETTRSSAGISLLAGTKIKLQPMSTLKILRSAIRLERGACLVRHAGKHFQLKLEGKASVCIESESLVGIECDQSRFLITVEKGGVRLLPDGTIIKAGKCVAAGPNGIEPLSIRPIPRVWEITDDQHSSENPDSTDADEPEIPEEPAETNSPGTDDLGDFKDILGL